MTDVFERRTENNTAQILAAQRGDRAAFGILYEQYARMIHGLLISHVAFPEAEDLMQDVFTVALERIVTLRDPESFGAWLCTIARNIAHDYHRKLHSNGIERDIQDHRSDRNPEALAVLEEIQKLPGAYRESLVLRLVEGMTGPEIARKTGMTEGSVRVNLCRGMKLLREALEMKNV